LSYNLDYQEPGSELGKSSKRKRFAADDAPSADSFQQNSKVQSTEMVFSTTRRTLRGQSKRILPSQVKDSGDVVGPSGPSPGTSTTILDYISG